MSGSVRYIIVFTAFVAFFVSIFVHHTRSPSVEDSSEGTLGILCAEDLVVSEDLLYLADGAAGIKVIDISDWTNPRIVSSARSEYALRLYIYSGHLYLCDGPGGLKVFSLTNPTQPELVFEYETEWATSAAFAHGNLYLGDYTAGFKIFNCRNPAEPSSVSLMVTEIWGRDITANDSDLFLCDQLKGLVTYDLSNPTRPVKESVNNQNFFTFKSIAVVENYVIIARSDEGTSIAVYDVSNLAVQRQVAEDTPSRFIEGLSISDDYLLVSCGEEGVTAYSLTDLPELTRVWTQDTPGYARMARISGNFLYVADMVGLCIYDLETIEGAE